MYHVEFHESKEPQNVPCDLYGQPLPGAIRSLLPHKHTSSFHTLCHAPAAHWKGPGEGSPSRQIYKVCCAFSDRACRCSRCEPQNCWGSTVLRVSYDDDEKFERAVAAIRRLALVAVDYEESRPGNRKPPRFEQAKLKAACRDEMDERRDLEDRIGEMNWLQLINDVQARQLDPERALTTDQIVSEEFRHRFHTTVVQDKALLDNAEPEKAEEYFQVNGLQKRESGARSAFFMYLDGETIDRLARAPDDETLAKMTIDERCRVAWDHWVKIVEPPDDEEEDNEDYEQEELEGEAFLEVEDAGRRRARRRRIRLLCLLSLYLAAQDYPLEDIPNEGANPHEFTNPQNETRASCFALGDTETMPSITNGWLAELYGKKEKQITHQGLYRPETPAFIEDLRKWREERAIKRAKLELAKPPAPDSSFAVFRHRLRPHWDRQGHLKPGRKIWQCFAMFNDQSVHCASCKPQNCWGSTIIRMAYEQGDDERFNRAVSAVRRLSLVFVDYDEEADHQSVGDEHTLLLRQAPVGAAAGDHGALETHWRDAARKVQLRGPPRFMTTDQIVSEEFKFRFHNTIVEDEAALRGQDVEGARLLYRESGAEAREDSPHLRSRFFIYLDRETLGHLASVPSDEELNQMTLEDRCRIAYQHWVKVVAPLPKDGSKVANGAKNAAFKRRIRLLNILPVYMYLLGGGRLEEVEFEATGWKGAQDNTEEWRFIGDSLTPKGLLIEKS